MIYSKIKHLKAVYTRHDEDGALHFHIELSCGAIAQAEVVVLGTSFVYLDGIQEHRPLLNCRLDCQTCILLDSEAEEGP